jgi:membrane protein DedA with SNARE-associated domain
VESIPFIAWCLGHLNYWVITLLMAIESSFIPFPSEVVIPPAAYMAAATGEMSLWLIILCATLGALIGATVNYVLALYLGRPIIYRFANSKLGHLCLIDEEKVKLAEHYFDEHGAIGTIVGRLVPAVRQLISIPAGLARMRFGRFLLYTAIGAGAWNCILGAIGYALASVVPYEQLDETVAEYSVYLKVLMLLVGLAAVYYLYRQYKK